MSTSEQGGLWTPRKLARFAGGYGHSYRDLLSDNVCYRLAFARIAMWLDEQEEVSIRTLHKVREAMQILHKEWNEEADRPVRVEDE